MKKLFISLLTIFGFIIALIFISITITDYDKIYKEFVKNSKVDINLIKSTNLQVKKFPTPYLTIEEIEYPGKVKLKNLEIRFSLFSLLKFSPKITSLNIEEASLYIDNNELKFSNHDEFIGELIKKDILSIKAKINKFLFIESDNDVAFNIKNFIFSNNGNKTDFSGKIDDVGKLNGNFEKSENQVIFNMSIEDASYSLNILEHYQNSILKEGKINIKTNNLANNIAKFIPNANDFIDQIRSAQEVEITSDISADRDWMNIKNIIVRSEAIEGKGEIKLSKNSLEESNLNIFFDKIDLISWQKSQLLETSVKYGNDSKFDFNKNKLRTNIFFKDIKISDNNTLSNVLIKTAINKGELYIEDFAGNINQTGNFRIVGTVTQNEFRNLFNGKISFNHQDINDIGEFVLDKTVRTKNQIPFSLSSDIKLSSVDVSLQNLLIKTNETDITGNLSTKFIGSSKRVNGNLRFTFVDVDEGNLPAISTVYNYIASLFQGMKSEDYLGKFIPIRKINSVGSYEIVFDRLKFKNKKYDNIGFNLETIPGNVTISQLYLQDEKDWIDTSLTLIAQGIKPELSIMINNGSIKAGFLSPNGMLELSKNLVENYDLSKIDIIINAAFKNLYSGDLKLENVKFAGKNDKNLFNIEKFEADLLGGRFQSSGSILLNPYTLNFVYALNSANILEIAKLMPRGFLDSGGVLSASGMWSTNGDNLDQNLYNFYTRSDVVAKDITINSISIDDFIQLIGVPNYNISSFSADLKNALLIGTTQISDLKTSIELSKGVFNLSNIKFKTKYTSGIGSAIFDLYKFDLDLQSELSFYLSKPKEGRNFTDYTATKMIFKAKGSPFAPKKEADTKELLNSLNSRFQQ